MFVKLPNEKSRVNDCNIEYHPDDPDLFEIITWSDYSPNTGEYNALVTSWKFMDYWEIWETSMSPAGPMKKKRKLRNGVFLLSVSIKRNNEEWNTHSPSSPIVVVSDQHKRRAREQARSKYGVKRFNNLFLLPPKKDMLVNPGDLIGTAHTRTLSSGV